MKTRELTMVYAAVLYKEGKGVEFVWEEPDIRYYVDVLGYTVLAYKDMYI